MTGPPEEEPRPELAEFFESTAQEEDKAGARSPSGAAAPDEQDDLVIVRDLTDVYAAAEEFQAAAPARPAQHPPPPRPVPPRAETPPPPEQPALVPHPEGHFPLDEEEEAPAEPPREEEAPAEPPREEEAPAEPARAAAPVEAATPAPAPAPRRRRVIRPRRPEPPLAAVLATIAAATLFAGATILAVAKAEPVHTWYYVFAWYPFLLVVNFATSVVQREHSVFLGRGRAMASLLAWSVPVWLFFELFNLRLENWYYTGVPAALLERRLGVILSFATVLPGIFLVEELLGVAGLFARTRSRAFTWRPAWDKAMLALGGAWVALVLVLPGIFFPLVWGFPVLLLEPWLRRGEGPSLVRDLTEGRPARILRLLVAGMICGLWWETANVIAGGKWVYTVPGLSALAPFEMPLFGFVGFAPFALCCWTIVRALVRLGLLPDWERIGEAKPEVEEAADVADRRKRRRWIAAAAAAVFALAMLAAMDRATVDSFRASAADVPGIPDGIPTYARHKNLDSPRGVLRLIRAGELYVPGESTATELDQLENTCRLMLLAGIGADNARRLLAVGVHSIEELAARDAKELTAALAALEEPGWHPRPRRVDVWVRAARKEIRAPS